jgi:hypothetical protein
MIGFLLNFCQIDPTNNKNEWFMQVMSKSTGAEEILGLLLRDPRINPTDQNYLAFRNGIRNFSEDMMMLCLEDYRVDIDKVNKIILNEIEYLPSNLLPENFITIWTTMVNNAKENNAKEDKKENLYIVNMIKLYNNEKFVKLYSMSDHELIIMLNDRYVPYIPYLDKVAVCLFFLTNDEEYRKIFEEMVPICSYLSYKSAITYMKEHNLYNLAFL